jgi:glucose-1-phosphate thymidylyltransferase
MWCVVPVAGRATRLRSLAAGRPKALLDIGGQPLIEHLLDRLGDPISAVCLVTAPETYDLFRGRLGEDRNGMQLRYAVQAEPAGVADAVSRAVATVRGPFGVVMGDCYFEGDLGPHFGRWRQAGDDGAVLVEPATAAEGQPMGLVVSSGGRIASIFKAPWEGQTEWRVAGVYMFPDSYFAAAAEVPAATSGEYELEDAVTRLIAGGATFSAMPYGSWRRNINTPEDLAAVEERLAGEGRPSDGSFP